MNPKLFQSAEFYHRRYHNFATVLVIPMRNYRYDTW